MSGPDPDPRMREDDGLLPGSFNGPSSPSSFLDAQAMARRGREARLERRLALLKAGVDPDLDTRPAVEAEQARQARRWPALRWLDWQRRRFSAWLRTWKRRRPR